MTGFCEKSFINNPIKQTLWQPFCKRSSKITSIQTMRPAPGDSVASEHASQNFPSGKSVRLATKMPLNPLKRFEEVPAAQALYKMQN